MSKHLTEQTHHTHATYSITIAMLYCTTWIIIEEKQLHWGAAVSLHFQTVILNIFRAFVV